MPLRDLLLLYLFYHLVAATEDKIKIYRKRKLGQHNFPVNKQNFIIAYRIERNRKIAANDAKDIF